MAAVQRVRRRVVASCLFPATMFFFWLRYLTRQDFRGTLLHGFLLTVSFATATSVPFLVSRVLLPGDIRLPTSKNIIRMLLPTTPPAPSPRSNLLFISFSTH